MCEISIIVLIISVIHDRDRHRLMVRIVILFLLEAGITIVVQLQANWIHLWLCFFNWFNWRLIAGQNTPESSFL